MDISGYNNKLIFINDKNFNNKIEIDILNNNYNEVGDKIYFNQFLTLDESYIYDYFIDNGEFYIRDDKYPNKVSIYSIDKKKCRKEDIDGLIVYIFDFNNIMSIIKFIG